MKYVILLLALLSPSVVFADDSKVSLTIYSSADPSSFNPQSFLSQQKSGYSSSWIRQAPGFGIVKDIRSISLKKGLNNLQFTDVAEFIDPTTVNIRSLDNTKFKILEQKFAFDLLSQRKLLEKYVGQEITVFLNRAEGVETVSGTLLASRDGVILQTKNGIRILPRSNDIQLAKLSEDLLLQPTLLWKIDSAKSGNKKVQTTYQTDGITWRSDYNLVLHDNEKKANLSAWVSILNVSGKSYKDTKLKLVAGDVKRVQPNRRRQMMDMVAKSEALTADAGFQEKSFFEYHLYTLGRPATVLNNSIQQISLFPEISNLSVNKELVYKAANSGHHYRSRPVLEGNIQREGKVNVYINLTNKDSKGLGLPLPAGKIRVLKEDKQDENLEFIGEDLIEHTPVGKDISIFVGNAFDVVGERKVTNFKTDKIKREIVESIELDFINGKNSDVILKVMEDLFRWKSWDILKSSHRINKEDSDTVSFDVSIPKKGNAKVSYTVKYRR